MKSKTLLLCAAGLGLALGVTVMSGTTQGAKNDKGQRSMNVHQLMEGTVKPHCTALKNGLKAEPADEKAWKKLVTNAALLNEASYSLMEDGRCPDKVWAEATTKTLRPNSAALVTALKAKNFAKAKTVFGAMTKSCKACHDEHKED
jgi:cytochrome c556